MRNHSIPTTENQSTTFPKLSRPNFTQIPNVYLDHIMPYLSSYENLLMLVFMRQTFGWGNKEWDRISLSQLEMKTGLRKQAILKAIKSLEKKGLIVKNMLGEKGEQKTYYKVQIEESEFVQKNITNSNNFDQCVEHTPPSVSNTHTKETNTKEKKEVGNIRSTSAPPPPTFFFSLGNHIRLSESEYEEIKKQLGDDFDRQIKNLEHHLAKSPKSCYHTMTTYQAMLRWIEKDKQKKSKAKGEKSVEGKEWVEKVIKNNPQVKQHLIPEKTYVQLGKSSGGAYGPETVEYGDAQLEAKVTKFLNKLAKNGFLKSYDIPRMGKE